MRITVVGSGAWGTALALVLCANGHTVSLWSHDPIKAARMRENGVNPALPEVPLPESLAVTSDPMCVQGCSLVVIASPSFAIRSVCCQISHWLDTDTLLVCATKGIEQGSLLRMSQIVAEETCREVVALTGPSHAEEVARGIPTGCVAASPNRRWAELVQDVFMSDSFRIYTSPDIVGAELGGALKNVIAICAGVSDGLGYGDNMKAMLMTRGLTEIARLGVSLGAERDTFAGLSGVGDLIVTCTSHHSRNYRAGVLIGKGMSPEEAMADVGAVVEGYYAARSAWELSRLKRVDMPIVHAAYAVLYQGVGAAQVVAALMNRSRKQEPEDSGWQI